MLPCPSCGAIVDVTSASCRYCGVAIDAETAHRLNAEFQRVTDAVASANTFKQSIWAAVLLTVIVLLYVLASGHLSAKYVLVSVAPVGFIANGVSWQRKYGALETQDMDYPGAVGAMRRALGVWIIALILQLAFLGYAYVSGALLG